jgi:GNAT superfamily N-acetyltransferase
MDLATLVETGEAAAFADLFRAAPAALAEALGIEVFAVGDATGLVVPKIDAAEFNRVMGLGVTRPARPEHIDAIVARYRALGLSSARLQVSPAAQPHAEIEGWLAARGLERSPRSWTKRARRTDALPDVATELAIIDAADAPGQFGATACAGSDMPAMLAPWLEALVGRPDWRCFLAMDGETAATAGALYLGPDCGWIGIGATLPDARGRGGQGAVMRARLSAAAAAGKAWAITETGAPAAGEAPGPSYRNMDRLGFVEVHVRPNYVI